MEKLPATQVKEDGPGVAVGVSVGVPGAEIVGVGCAMGVLPVLEGGVAFFPGPTPGLVPVPGPVISTVGVSVVPGGAVPGTVEAVLVTVAVGP